MGDTSFINLGSFIPFNQSNNDKIQILSNFLFIILFVLFKFQHIFPLVLLGETPTTKPQTQQSLTLTPRPPPGPPLPK